MRAIPSSPRLLDNPKALALLTIALWSFGTYLSRLIAIKSEFLLLSFTFFFALLALAGNALVSGGGLRPLRWRGFQPLFLLFGPLGYFLYSVALNQSSRSFDSMSETTILNYTWPVFTILFTDLVFRRSRRKSGLYVLLEALGVGLGFASVFLLATRGDFSAFQINLPGILWGLTAGISYGLYGAYSGTLEARDQNAFLLVSVSSSLVLISLFSISELDQLSSITVTDLLVTFAVGFVLDGFGYIAWTRANRLAREQQINISSVASIMFALPVVSLVIVSLLLGEQLLFRPYFLVCLLMITLSSIVSQKTEYFEKKLAALLERGKPAGAA